MDTADGMDLEKIEARRAKHKARGINGNGFGESLAEAAQKATRLWPTAKTSRGGYEIDPKTGKKVLTLEGAASLWMAPRASENEETAESYQARRMRMAPADRMGATGTLSIQAQNWAAPCAMNHKGSSEGSIMRQDGKSRADLLHYQAEQLFCPPLSSQAQPIAGGSISSTDSPNTNQPSAKRKLNPIFVEALMRWPTGLSGFERREMESTLWQQRMLGFLSMLCSREPEAQMDLFGEAA
jgi:hypothetical protein